SDLVLVGGPAEGTKELVAVADGERESTDAWAELLRDLRRRGMRAPVLAVGDGALGLGGGRGGGFPAPRRGATGSTRRPSRWAACPRPCRPAPAGRWPRSATPPTATTPNAPSRRSPPTTAPNGPRPWPRWSTTPRSCCASSTSPPSTGCTSRPATPSSRPSRRSGLAPA